MILSVSRLLNILRRAAPYAIALAMFVMPCAANAAWAIVDAFDLSPIVPMVLDALMSVATGGYEFFVGRGNGIIYILVWGFLVFSISLYLVKLYFPKKWVAFFGFSGGGEMADGKAGGMTITMNVIKPIIRAIIAAAFLLQLKPVYITQWLINPFLQFGALYTNSIISTINTESINVRTVSCPASIVEKEWISQSSCEFLVQPVAILSHANNQVIKRGFEFLNRGLRGLLTLIPHGGVDFMNVVTGILLIATFVECNLFMALLIIQAIFNFGMALILYPFQVLTWVVKPKSDNGWFDIWPVFSGITDALRQLIITMIACAFILIVNVAIINALFQQNTAVFSVAAGGMASGNVTRMASGGMGFGQHSILWISAILTFYVMLRVFNMTRQRLNDYSPKMDKLYTQTKSDAKNMKKVMQTLGKQIGDAFKGK